MNKIIPKSTPTFSVALLIWGTGALFYLMGFFHRVSPAVITSELMRDFQINGAALGNLSALYFYSYVGMQIPTGILADTLGPRKLLTAGTVFAAGGAILFGCAPDYLWAGVGRLIIGGSVAVAFVCLLKIGVNWFPPNRFALVSGLALFSGIVGAVCAGPPLRMLVNVFGWREVTVFSGFFTLIIGASIWLFVRNCPSERGYQDFPGTRSDKTEFSPKQVLADLFELFTYRNTLLLFLIPGGVVGAVLTFSGLWGVPYLEVRFSLSPRDAATVSTSVLIAWAIGGPFFGWFSDKVGNRKKVYLSGCCITACCWLTLFSFDNLELARSIPVLLLAGFSSGCMIISFAFIKESVPVRLSGTVSGVINMGVMMGPMILQPAVGYILDMHWDGKLQSGIRIYSLEAYSYGLSLLLFWITLSAILLLFTKETGCRQLHS